METGLFFVGEVRKIYTTPDFTDRRTGEITEGRSKVQLEYEETLKNGETKYSMRDLTCNEEQARAFDSMMRKLVIVCVSVMKGERDVIFYLSKTARPHIYKGLDLPKLATGT